MTVEMHTLTELPAALAGAWAAIVRESPALRSPFLTPEFARIAASTMGRVEVAVARRPGQDPVFLPFQRGARGVGRPVAGRMSDLQAVIARDGAAWDPAELVRGGGLHAWRFDHLLAGQPPLRRYHWAVAPSPFVDLSRGFEGWRRERRAVASREVEAILYKRRRAERRLGDVRFELHTTEDEPFRALLEWKAAQHAATGQPALTRLPRVVALADAVRRERGPGFAGVLSALWLGGRLAAVHLGMRSATVLHYWLPAYDPALAAASPGQLCFLELARAAASEGITRIDLGRGDEPYKLRLASASTEVAEGAVDLRPVAGRLDHGRYSAVQWLRRSPLRRALLRPARLLRRLAARDAWV